MSMYQVHEHREGKNGCYDVKGRLWENGHGFPAWECIWQGRRKAEAIAAADACGMHATVVIAYTSDVIHDNGKQPGRRERPFQAVAA